MATFSNLVSSPQSNALNSKINPAPITPPKSSGLLGSLPQSGFSFSNFGKNVGSGISALGGLLGGSAQAPNQTASVAQAVPTTALKSQSTGADGSTKTEYHAPTPPAAPTPATPATPTSPTFNSSGNDYPLSYQGLVQAAIQATNEAANAQKNLTVNENNLGLTGAPLPVLNGEKGILQENYGATVNAANQRAQVLGGLATANIPQQYGLTSQPYNPLTDNYGGGGADGAINRAVRASNIGSAEDFQNKIQSINSQSTAADNNIAALASYAQQFNLGNTPILNGLKQLAGNTVDGNKAVAGYQAQLATVRSQYQALTGADPIAAIPDNITAPQLLQIQRQLKDAVGNNVKNLQSQLGQLQNTTPQTAQAPTSNSAVFGGAAWQ